MNIELSKKSISTNQLSIIIGIAVLQVLPMVAMSLLSLRRLTCGHERSSGIEERRGFAAKKVNDRNWPSAVCQ